MALIIDEAQHALTSQAGEAAMPALKSARDQMNSPGQVNLMLVRSGSERDKLLRPVVSADAPFYGSQIQALPLLDTYFIVYVAGLVQAQRPDLVPVDRAAVQAAFAAFGHRPQFFMAAMGALLSPLSRHTARFEPALQQAAQDQQVQDEAQMGSHYLGLRPTLAGAAVAHARPSAALSAIRRPGAALLARATGPTRDAAAGAQGA